MFLSVQALGGHIYSVPVSSSTTVRDVKKKIRQVDEDWKGTGIAPSTSTTTTTTIISPPTRHASISHIPEFHQQDEPSRNTPAVEEEGIDMMGTMEVIQEEDPYSEYDQLFTSDGKPLLDTDCIDKLLPENSLRQRNASIVQEGIETERSTSPTVLYRLKTYPSYGDYLQVQMRRYQADKGWKGFLVNFTLITIAAFFLAAMAQASFNLPQSWSDYLDLKAQIAVTFQTFAVLLSATLLGKYRSTLSIVMYLLMICAGAPFGALHKGGTRVLWGSSAGYLYSYLFASYVVGYLAERGWDRRYRTIVLSMIIGNLIIYAFGLLWLPFGAAFQSPTAANPAGKNAAQLFCGPKHGCVGNVLYAGLIPFIPGDAIKIVMAAFILPIGWKILGWRASQKQISDQKQQDGIQMA